MSAVMDIPTASIDPQSKVNVRRSQIEESVTKVKASIAEHGFWRNNPIAVRPHPDSTSRYKYEVVAGQCRLRACSDLGVEEIPAVVQEIDDDTAIRQSWAENEGRSDITPSDKAYWVNKIVKKHYDEGRTLAECRRIAAKFLAMSAQTVGDYQPMAFLPEEVKKMTDDGRLALKDAKAIAKSCIGLSDVERSEQVMTERAEWVLNLDDRDEKKEAAHVFEELGPKASIEELSTEVKKRVTQRKMTLQVAIPEALRGQLRKWGEERGLTDEATIIGHMIAQTLRGN